MAYLTVLNFTVFQQLVSADPQAAFKELIRNSLRGLHCMHLLAATLRSAYCLYIGIAFTFTRILGIIASSYSYRMIILHIAILCLSKSHRFSVYLISFQELQVRQEPLMRFQDFQNDTHYTRNASLCYTLTTIEDF